MAPKTTAKAETTAEPQEESQEAAEAPRDPNSLIYINHPVTGGVKPVRLRSLKVWEKRGWKEGAGPAEGLVPETPEALGQIDPEVQGAVAAQFETQQATATDEDQAETPETTTPPVTPNTKPTVSNNTASLPTTGQAS